MHSNAVSERTRMCLPEGLDAEKRWGGREIVSGWHQAAAGQNRTAAVAMPFDLRQDAVMDSSLAHPPIASATWLRAAWLMFLALYPPLNFGAGSPPQFDERKYDSRRYRVSQFKSEHGEAQIQIVLAKKIRDTGTKPHACRAWLEVATSGNKTFSRFFDDIEGVGASYGLFVPSATPYGPYFAVIKSGDYDGRLYLIRQDGTVLDLPGGFFLISPDGRYLFSEWLSDGSAVTVVDLDEGRVVFSSNQLPYIHEWYQRDGEVFFTESQWKNGNNAPVERRGVIYRYDFGTHKFLKEKRDPRKIPGAAVWPFTFDPRKFPDCSIPATLAK